MLNTETVKRFFEQILLLQKEYEIPDCKIYNMDEKGFQMSQTVSDYVVFDKNSGPSVTSDTDITQWVSVIEYISNQMVLKPYLIHIGKQSESD